MAANRNITYVKPSEPSFLTKFKKDVGYKEGPTVDSKKELPQLDDLPDRPDEEDEKPVVVVLKKGDLSKEEADQALKEIKSQEEEKNEDDQDPGDGRIMFRKPTKRSQSDKSDMNVSSSKKSKDKKKARMDRDNSGKKVKNASLLSFGGDEGEEEDT